MDEDETQRRSKRLLGVMLGTLNDFKKSVENKTEAASIIKKEFIYILIFLYRRNDVKH
jgi:hypothetical protein